MKKILTLISIEKKLKSNKALSSDDVKFLLDNLNKNEQVKIDYAYYLCTQNKYKESLSLIKEVLPSIHGEKLYSVCLFLLSKGDAETFLDALDLSVAEGHPKAIELDKYLKEHYSREEIIDYEISWRDELIQLANN